MNKTSAFAHETPGGMYHAMVRLPRDARARPIKGRGDKPIRYANAYDAQKAASDAICKWINGNLVRDGARLLDHFEEAEKLFGGIDDDE